jgi:hypothetical protein
MLTVTDVVENGIHYRITEDDETGFYLKESMQEMPEPEPQPQPSRMDQLEEENADLKARVSDMELAFAELITGGM